MNDRRAFVSVSVLLGLLEACIQKAIVEYGSSMQMTPELQSAKNDIVAASKQATELISSSSHTSSAGRPMGLVPLLPADCIEILAIGLMQSIQPVARRCLFFATLPSSARGQKLTVAEVLLRLGDLD